MFGICILLRYLSLRALLGVGWSWVGQCSCARHVRGSRKFFFLGEGVRGSLRARAYNTRLCAVVCVGFCLCRIVCARVVSVRPRGSGGQ